MLTRYGRREWGLATVVALALGAVLFLLGWWWAAIPVAIAWFAVAMFFRDPPRRIPTNLPPGAMISPADGVVSAVLRVAAHEAVDGAPAVIIRIFLSVLDVHVNRAPCAVEVTGLDYRPGKFLDARSEESARVNESNLVLLRLESGEPIGLRQVSGKVARRIVCPIAVGDRFAAGERFGMIKFGSTAEVILPRPDDVDVRVAVGDRVVGGRTILAVLPPRS